jgi:electron transfer flavoprotein alpha subunit
MGSPVVSVVRSQTLSEIARGGVLCFVERDDGGLADASLRALTLARGLCGDVGRTLAAVAVGEIGSSEIEVLAQFGVGDAYQVVFDDLDTYAPSAYATALLDLAEMLSSDALVAAGTDRGQEIMAHVGARTGLAMAANCLSASWLDARSLELSRQRWGGSLVEDAVLEGVPALLTVASDGVLAVASPSPASPTVRTLRSTPSDLDRRVSVSQWISRGGGVALADARIVVGGGRGVGSEEGFDALDELAALLGAAVGVSRAVTSAGWRPHAQQVGQTGTKISPELYLACGISGATQHLAGCRSAKHVVTINTDPDAPFLARADYALVGDLSVIIPALSDAIRSRRTT